MASTFQLATSDLSRLFLFPSGINSCTVGSVYMPCVSVDALTQDLGDRTPIKCPDPFRYASFIEVGTVRGEESRMTTTLSGRLTRDELSQLLALAKGGCRFDAHVHWGLCASPDNFDVYDKAFVFEDIFITSYGTDALIAVNEGDVAEVNETVDISIGNFYEIVPLNYVERGAAQSATTLQIIDGVYADSRACGGECGTASDGCQVALVSDGEGDAMYSINGGVDWTVGGSLFGSGVAATNITTGIDVLGGIVWVYNDTGEIVFIERDSYLAGGTVQTVASLNTTGLDQDSGQTYGLVVGTAGYVGRVTSPSLGFSSEPTPVTANDLTHVKFNAALDAALLAGAANTLVYTEDGLTLEVVTTVPVGQAAVAITAAYPITENKWIIGYADGTVWCTDDAGATWTQGTLPVAVTNIRDFGFSSTHVLWMAADTAIFKSINGGMSWVQAPEGSKKVLPTNTAINAIVACVENVNVVLGVGQDSATAGIVIHGNA